MKRLRYWYRWFRWYFISEKQKRIEYEKGLKRILHDSNVPLEVKKQILAMDEIFRENELREKE